MNRQEESDSLIDESLRSAYRDYSSESPSVDLDAAVLEMAREQPSPAQRWMQPLALAATVLLCVAIVLQTPFESPPPVDAVSLDTVNLDAVKDEPMLDDAAVGKQDLAPAQAETEPASANSPAARPDANAARLEQRVEQRGPAADAAIQAAEVARQKIRPEAERDEQPAFDVDNRELLETAERMATLRSGSPSAPPAGSVASFSVMLPACNDEQRETEPAWLECIETLEEEGRHEAARDERLQLELAFPPDD